MRFSINTVAGVATWLLLTACALTLAQLTWMILPAQPLPAPRAATVSLANASVRAPKLSDIAALHLFGQPAAPAATQTQNSHAQAPETSLNLTLRGVFSSARQEEAFAIIAVASQPDRPFRIGDKISGAAVLHEVLADRIVLEHAGRYETLRLPRDRLATLTPSAPSPNSKNLGGKLQALRAEIRQNPQSIMQLAQLQPARVDGQLRGYRLLPRQHHELFTAAGLTSGDIITAVNGASVTDPAQFANITQQLTSARSLQLSVERPSGMSEIITLDIN